MKIRLDFVSNSSSTSFVYISKEELSVETFLQAAGVEMDSPLAGLFQQMHAEITKAVSYYGTPVADLQEADELALRGEFTPEVIARIKEAIDRGESVVTAEFSSDGPLAEAILCMTMFEIKSDQFFINAYNNYW